MRQNRDKLEKIRFVVSFALASIVALLWMGIAQASVDGKGFFLLQGVSQLSRYAVCLCLFVLVFLVCSFCVSKINAEPKHRIEFTLRPRLWMDFFLPLCALCFAAAALPGVKTMLGSEYAVYVGLKVKLAVIAAGFIAIAAWYWFQKHPAKTPAHQTRKILFLAGALFTIMVAAWVSYAPNVMHGYHDYEAYWFSTFSLVRGIPLDPYNTTSSFYGHYGMLQAPFFWLLGGFTPYTCALLTALESAAIAALLCYVISCITTRTWLRYLGLGALLFQLAKPKTVYAQGYPHRYLFPVILLALAAWLLKRMNTRSKAFFRWGIIFGYLLAGLALIWANDTGLICVLAWGVFHFYCIWPTCVSVFAKLASLAKPIVAIVLTVLCAWGFVSLLNVVVWGGQPRSFNDFSYPLTGTVQSLNAFSDLIPEAPPQPADSTAQNTPDAPQPSTSAAKEVAKGMLMEGGSLPLIAPWVPSLLFLLYYAARGIETLFFSKKKRNERLFLQDVAFFASVLGIGVGIYFFNRATYGNFNILYFQLVICMLISIENQIDTLFEKSGVAILKRGMLLLTLIVLSCIGGAAIGEIPYNVSETRRNQDMSGVEAMLEKASQRFPTKASFYGFDATFYNAALNVPTENIIWTPGVNIRAPILTIQEIQSSVDANIIITDTSWSHYGSMGIDYDKWHERYEFTDTIIVDYFNKALPGQAQPVAFRVYQLKEKDT